MIIKLSDGRVKDVPVTQVTAENYIVPENEKHLFHVIIEVRKFNPETGERLSKPRVQKFGRKAFLQNVRKNLIKQGYTITILHEAEELPVAKSVAPVTKSKVEDIVAEAVAKALAEQEAKFKAEIDETKKMLAEKKGKGGRKAKEEKPNETESAPEESAETAATSENDGKGVETPTEE